MILAIFLVIQSQITHLKRNLMLLVLPALDMTRPLGSKLANRLGYIGFLSEYKFEYNG